MKNKRDCESQGTQRPLGYKPDEEPDAGKPHVWICEGRREQSFVYSTKWSVNRDDDNLNRDGTKISRVRIREEFLTMCV